MIADGWNVIPFIVPHTNTDGSYCENYAYIIDHADERLLYMTDWMYCPFNLASYNINHFLIAVNYTEMTSETHVLHGHSSLQTVKSFLEASVTDACKSIIGCHLSDRNADEQQILTELRSIVPETVLVGIADRWRTFKL